MHIQKRVFASFIFALASFILSLLVLTAGSKPGFLEDASIITAKYTYGNETSNVTEWYSVYFLTECVGNIANDGVTKVNTTCYKYPSPESDFNLQKSFIPWTIGVAFAGFDALLLPVFFGGRIYWNGWMLFFLWIPWFALLIGGVLSTISGTGDLVEVFPGGGPGRLFLPLVWTAVGCVLVAAMIEVFEYGLQKYTPRGEIIAAKYKPEDIPWFSYNARGLIAAEASLGNTVTNGMNMML